MYWKKEDESLRDISVANILSSDVISVSPDDDFQEVARVMCDKNVSCIAVVADEKIV